MTRQIFPILVIALLAGPAAASVSFDFIFVDNSAALTGYNTFDLQMYTPDSDWTSAALLLNVSAGSIYQDPNGGDGPPNPFLFDFFPTLEFDTYVGVPGGSIAGGAGDLGGDAFEFSTTELDVSFYNIANTDLGSFPIGRVTLSDNAVGSWSFVTITADKQRLNLTGTITGGAIEIETETFQVRTITAVSIVSPTDGTTLLTKTVTDSIREQAGNGLPGSANYEEAVKKLLFDVLDEEIDRQRYSQPAVDITPEVFAPIEPGTTATFSFVNRFSVHYEWLTISESEYLQSIASQTASAESTLPEPGTVVLLGLGGLGLLRRRRR